MGEMDSQKALKHFRQIPLRTSDHLGSVCDGMQILFSVRIPQSPRISTIQTLVYSLELILSVSSFKKVCLLSENDMLYS